MTQADAYQLVSSYINVVNNAMLANEDRFPYNRILDAGEKLLKDKVLGIAVYKDDTEHPYDHYALKWRNRKLELYSDGKPDADWSWKVSRDHLKQVVDHPSTYINQPAKLDWHWLKDRLGLTNGKSN